MAYGFARLEQILAARLKATPIRPAPATSPAARIAAATPAVPGPREEMAKALGLPVTATWDEIRAKQAQVTSAAAIGEVARAQLADVVARGSDEVSNAGNELAKQACWARVTPEQIEQHGRNR